MARQGRDARQSARKVDGLREGHRLRRTRYALFHNAVVGTEDDDAPALYLIMYASGNAGELNGERFQPAEAFRRLGKAVLPLARTRHGSLVKAAHGADDRKQVLFFH